MQCVNALKKRRLEPEVEPWSCRKRVCLGAELQETECPMEISQSFTASSQHPEQPVVRPRPALACPRCLGGEPGHINHILSL